MWNHFAMSYKLCTVLNNKEITLWGQYLIKGIAHIIVQIIIGLGDCVEHKSPVVLGALESEGKWKC